MAQTFNGSSSSRQGSLGSMLSDARCSSNPTKFASLNEAIGHNITSINASTKQLQKLLKLIRNAKDVSVLQEQIHSINSKTNELVEITSDDLRRLQARLRHGDRQQKLQLERLTSEFQHVLVKYSEQQKRNWKVLRQSYQEAVAAEREADVSQQQRQEQADLESEHNMLVERHRQVEQLHSDIVDVHLTMNELRKLTIEQGEVVDNVETLIDRTAANVEDGCIELQTIVNRRNSTHRKKLILLFPVLLIILVLIGIIIWKLKANISRIYEMNDALS